MLKQHFDYSPQRTPDTTLAKQETPTRVTVQITSEPPGAEIYVNDVFSGSAPSTLQLSPGEHVLRITRPGFKVWEREITVEVGAVKTFNAILDK